MKGILAFIIIVALLYFGYMAFSGSSVVQQPKQSERLDEYGLSDLRDSVPDGAQGALVDVNVGIQGFFEKIRISIEKARLAIRGKSSTNIEIQ